MGTSASTIPKPTREREENESPEQYVRALAVDRKSALAAYFYVAEEGHSEEFLQSAKNVWLFYESVDECAERHSLGNSREWTERHLLRKNSSLSHEQLEHILSQHDWSAHPCSGMP